MITIIAVALTWYNQESYDRNGPVCFTGGEHRLCDWGNLEDDPCITYREGKPRIGV